MIATLNRGDKVLAVLKRVVYGEKSTIGELYANGVKFCNTLEDVDRGLHQWMTTQEIAKIKVAGVTAIPRGYYHCRTTWSPRFGKYMIEILNVPGFSGVRMHAGNDADDTEGCPLLGDYDQSKPDWVGNSRVRCSEFNALVEHIGGEFDLLIV